MKNKLSLAIACGLTTMCVATTGFANEKSFNIGGDVELDLTGTDRDDSSSFNHGGRIKINAVGMVKSDNGHFVKGVAQPLVLFNPGTTALPTQDEDLFVNNDAVAVDDAYLQIGKEGVWDIQMGRFEAMNLLPLGKDTLVANVDGIVAYSANDVRGRRDDTFHAALHVGSSDKFLFELGMQARKNGDDKIFEVRPAISYQLGSVKLHAGYEDLEGDASGFGIGAGFKLGGGDLNVGLAQATDYPSSVVGKIDVTTVAVNYTKGPWGVGYLHAEGEVVDVAGRPDPSLDTVYAAYTLPIYAIKDASVTFAASYSEGEYTMFDGTNFNDDDLTAVRARFNYTF
ncbi:carbohydrate porin [Cocleimonas sp. KMM 6892]|jgi:hypothetical protein|uniref:carbohydrate porin n=1 Tax=unclassified Cocleimonas TaxID=2639732 RepID=UPI002DB8475F|nr:MULTISPECIES: carbohydrate porin [unclassified Cocleimonas]MEB8432763.1 carbohydrate porin [Cocleimonas sp. KMM 6892]MEC4715622.1 carbohydrate porin [Cocleimonas sp. KMM 6895]MEC4744760.1 carbohydrate porin [Cocleimonas sp. KMM 6896]